MKKFSKFESPTTLAGGGAAGGSPDPGSARGGNPFYDGPI